MTDNEIVKALECCSYDNCFMLCDECPLKNDGCVDVLIPSVLSLIKRQQAEIKVCERIVRDLHLDDLEREAIQATAVTAAIRDMERALETAKAKAVREFAERLKERFAEKLGNTKESFACFSICREIDNLVTEMVGVDNDKL